MYLIIANIERISMSEFIVACVYDDNGQLVDQIAKPFESYEQVTDLLLDELFAINQRQFEVWTSDGKLYGHLLALPGAAALLKHSHDTYDTKLIIKQNEEILRDLYELGPAVVLPALPKWREWLYDLSLKITYFIGGNGKYDSTI